MILLAKGMKCNIDYFSELALASDRLNHLQEAHERPYLITAWEI